MPYPRFPLFVLALVGALPVGAAEWKPAEGPLRTRWTQDVRPDTVHAEYPRPHLVRSEWLNLNGLWDYAIRQRDAGHPDMFVGQILVPFPVESALSGVMRRVGRENVIWYRRMLPISRPNDGSRWLLRFEAVDWRATVYINGTKLGEHTGGYDPFVFDVTDACAEGNEQELVVAVWDPTDQGFQPRGKQVDKPAGIWYTPVTGIWQTVWLERVPAKHIRDVRIVPDFDRRQVRVTVESSQPDGPAEVQLEVASVALGDERTPLPPLRARGLTGQEITLDVDPLRPWTPVQPWLYDLRVTLVAEDRPLDAVTSYFGVRKIAVAPDKSGIPRLCLNGEPLFQFGPLDQGWWPDGLYTAPSDAALRYDIDITKQLGFNMIRKHVKVEPARWYYHCDRVGMLVWQDMPSADNRGAEGQGNFARELRAMVDARRHHPSIVMWVPFNEGWGQHATVQYVDWLRQYDPTRLVNNASGWTDERVGDVNDIHVYPGPGMPALETVRAAVLGEFGGLGLPLAGHLWVDRDNWGYQNFQTREELAPAYEALIQRLRGLVIEGLAAAVYTQTTDVEIEVNGLMTYDREVLKLPLSIAEWHARLYMPPPQLRTLLATAQLEPQDWRYTMQMPAADWIDPAFDDAAWKRGPAGFGTSETPGTRVRTNWNSSDIWLRRTFESPNEVQGQLALRIHHDEDAEVYLNGQRIAALSGYTSGYQLVPLPPDVRRWWKSGSNTLAVHCRQTGGGQYIDVGFVTLDDIGPRD